MSKLNKDDAHTIQDLIWSNPSNKDKQAAIIAATIMFANKLENKDVPMLCELARVPISMGVHFRQGMLVAEKIRELKGKDNGNKDTKHS